MYVEHETAARQNQSDFHAGKTLILRVIDKFGNRDKRSNKLSFASHPNWILFKRN